MNKYLTAFIALSIQLGSAQAAPMYTITDLGTLGAYSVALAISNNGYIVGDSATNDGIDHATLFNQGAVPTAFAPGSSNPNARAYGVNDSGVAVGLAIFNPWGTSAAVFTSGGIAIDLGTLGGASSQANAINNNGQIVGYSNTVNSNFHPEIHATLFNIGGSPIDLGTLGGNWSSADAINNSGQIVGYSSIYENSPVHATLFDSGAGPIDLGVLDGYSGSLAEGINDSGQIIGRSYLRDLSGALYGYQATLFDIGDIPMGLGSLGGNYSYANGINNQGQIVGYSSRPGDLDIRATIFGYGISPIDLNDLIDPLSGWTLQHATAINSNGDIVGYGLINGQTRAFLASPVPEPATLLLLGIGFVGLGFTKISRKS